ncbi:MAG: signal peptidase I [Desulfobacterales bacterium]|nr:signal peptidase I [Desulfobacterales bacterium]
MKSEKSTETESEYPKKGALRENIEAILVAIVIALFIRTFVVQAFKIPSGSMKQTLQIGDHILVNKFIYGVKVPYLHETIIPLKKPRRGDIIVFKYPVDPHKDFIKRVIGIPGDEIEIRDKKLYVNQKRVNHDYGVYTDSRILSANVRPRDNFGPVTVPQHSLFVMGDNRDESFDSRFWGFVDYKALNGKAFIIYWSWPNWKRFLHLIK